MDNKTILEQANAAVSAGDHETFLSFCTADTEWIFVGEQTLKGKEAVRQYMAKVYVEPPKFMVEKMIAEGESVVATGRISMKEGGEMKEYTYCDVWTFRDGKLDRLKAFVI